MPLHSRRISPSSQFGDDGVVSFRSLPLCAFPLVSAHDHTVNIRLLFIRPGLCEYSLPVNAGACHAR